MDTFQNRNLAPADWENLADPLLKRGVQKVADELRKQSQPAAERDENFEPLSGASDDCSVEEAEVRRSSRQTKEQGAKTLWGPSETFYQGGLRRINRESSTKSGTSGVSKTANGV